MKLKTILTFIYLLTSALVFLFFRAHVIVWISFFINFSLITGITYFHLNIEKTFSPFLTSFIVFFYLFGIVAPIIQISSFDITNDTFPNKYPFDVLEVVFVNFLIFSFCAIFFVSYLFFKGKSKINFAEKTKTPEYRRKPIVILVLFILSLIILVMNFDYLIEDISRKIYIKSEESVSSQLIRKKVIFFIPLGAMALTYNYLKKRNKINNNTIISLCIFFSLVLILFFFKNPFTEKRNALGPIYILLIYMFSPRLINSNAKFFLFMFLALVIVFPTMSTFTHINANFNEIIEDPSLVVDSYLKYGGISASYSTLHYDAFANILATVDYVGVNGLSFGFQLLGTLLFFIPRGVWSEKPISTGELIGIYLDDFGFSFDNLSNPLISEGYINFGLLGVFLFAILLAYFIVVFIKWMKSGDYLKEVIAFYFSVHLIFFLRGDLTNGFTYFIGPLIAVYLIPKMIERIIK